MDIRTKLIFALVAVALASMAALGVLMYMSADEALRLSRIEQLDGLAEAEKDAVQQVAAGWRDRVRLIASRTQLRESLEEYVRSASPGARTRVADILTDARRAVRIVESLAVYDLEGQLVASATPVNETLPAGAPPPAFAGPSPGLEDAPREEVVVHYEGITGEGADGHRVSYAAELTVEGRRVGTLRAQLSARALEDLTRDRTGLGRTGETLLFIRDTDGAVHILRPLVEGETEIATESEAGPHPDILDVTGSEFGPGSLVRLALEGVEGRYWEDMTDDRGVPVWAAIRTIPETGWGVVVKLDTEEARERVRTFRRHMGELATALGGFAILFGTFLGFRFARPLQDLAKVARRIGEGELSVRADVKAEDEVGLLARTMNQMAEDLEKQVGLLQEFERFFEVSLDLLCIAGTDGYFKRVNPSFVKSLGWSAEELTTQPFLDLVHPDDLDATHEEIERLTRGIPTISFENRFRCVDGGYRHLVWTAYPEPDTGLLYAVARDVTELDQERTLARERMRSLEARLAEAEGEGPGSNEGSREGGVGPGDGDS
jgi:PAS domain S-box-containing protein